MNPIPVVDFKPLFETLPGLYLILNPGFTIVAVSDAYLNATMTNREAIIGHGLFEVFPDNPEDKEATGVSNLRTSLNTVLQFSQPHKMAVQKYDIRRPDGVFEEKYWSPLNSPVFNEAHELVYIIHNVVDVTEQHRSSEKLKKSEKDYQMLVSSVKDYAIFMIDPNGLVASWNSGAESIKGYAATEIIGKPISVFYTDDDIKQGVPQINLQKALQHGHFEAEGWRLRKDGSLFWANIVITALKDEAGILYGYSKITRDITERKKAQNELESLTRQINQSNEAIFTIDTNRKIRSWNMGAQKLYGFTKEEVLGKDTKELFMIPQSAEKISIAANAIAEQGYWSGEVRRKTKTGEEITVRSSVTAIKDDTGAITGYVVVNFDITEQKRLREQVNHLGNIAEQSSEAIISRGIIDQRFISWNRGAEILLGYSKEEAIGKKPKELGIIRFTGEEIAGIEKEVFENGSWESEKEFYHKNGSSFFGAVTANAIKNEEGEITSMVFIIKDISTRKQLEDQLKKYNTELEQEVKAGTEEIIKSESRFRALIENSNDVVSLMDESFKVVYRSPSAFRITGWTDEEMINTNGIKKIHPEDIDKARDIVKELMANPAKPINCLFRTLHKHGHYLWMEGVVINLLDDEYVKAIVFNFRDVTERINAENKLTASERRFRTLIENNHDIIVLTDELFKIIYRSPSATRITGWTDEEMQSIDLIQKVHPDDKKKIAGIFEECMASPGKHVNASYRTYNKQGDCLHMEGLMINLLHEEDVQAIVLNLRDVTERIEAEAKIAASEMRFRLLIENSADGIDLSDEFSNSIYRSPGAIKITGNLPKENQMGFTHPDDVETIKNLQEEFIKKPGVPIAFQARFRHALGHYIWLEGTVTNLLHVAGVQAFVTNFRDVTARIESEEKLATSEKLFRMMIENSAEGVSLLDKHSNVIYRSGAGQKIIGNSPKTNSISHAHPLDKKMFKKKFEESLKNPGKPVEYQVRFPHASGNYFWAEGCFTNLLDVKGVNAVIANYRDITQRKEAEHQKEFDAHNLDALINNTHDLLWSVDRDFKLITSNKAFDDMMWSMTGVMPRKGYSILLEELGERKLEHFTQYYKRAFAGEIFTEIEHDGNAADFWSEISFYPIYEGKSVIGTACFSRDITEKKKAEQELKRSFDEKKALAKRMSIILNTLPANIALLDGQGNIIEVNDAWRSFADDNGFTGSAYCVGDNYIDIAGKATGKEKQDGKQVALGINAVLKNRLKEFVFEYPCDSAKIKRWFRMVVTPLQEKAHAGAVVMHIDISELRRLEQERLRLEMEEQKKITKAMLIGQEKERNYIGQELHDNINQILAGTKMFLGIAGNKNKEVKELIKYPMELLDSSMQEIRTLCHKMVTPLKNIDLEELIRNLLNRFEQASKIRSRFTYAVEDIIISDELQLNIYRIIQELVNNIHKYAGAKKVSINVKAGNKAIVVTVTDDGKGFDPEKKRKGVGISNIISRAASFNGTVEIKSSEGNGCRTRINIPC